MKALLAASLFVNVLAISFVVGTKIVKQEASPIPAQTSALVDSLLKENTQLKEEIARKGLASTTDKQRLPNETPAEYLKRVNQ